VTEGASASRIWVEAYDADGCQILGTDAGQQVWSANWRRTRAYSQMKSGQGRAGHYRVKYWVADGMKMMCGLLWRVHTTMNGDTCDRHSLGRVRYG
jgi:hypothetical protein